MLTRNEGVSVIKDETAGDRCRRVLLGLAAGDLNGGPTRMALRLADSLLDCGGFDAADISRRYVQWWRVDAVDTGPTSGRVLQRIADGMIPEVAAETVDRDRQGLTAGCNPAHRAPPLAMAGFLPDERLMAFARHEAALTHKHPIAGDVSAAVVVLCRTLPRTAWPKVGNSDYPG
jgi:ADP-ribosylglycohydrolase